MSDEEIDHLTVEDLLDIAAGAVGDVTIRDGGLLATAAERPQLTVYGDDAYPTWDEKAAASLHSLVRNHAPWSTGTGGWPGRPPESSAS